MASKAQRRMMGAHIQAMLASGLSEEAAQKRLMAQIEAEIARAQVAEEKRHSRFLKRRDWAMKNNAPSTGAAGIGQHYHRQAVGTVGENMKFAAGLYKGAVDRGEMRNTASFIRRDRRNPEHMPYEAV